MRVLSVPTSSHPSCSWLACLIGTWVPYFMTWAIGARAASLADLRQTAVLHSGVKARSSRELHPLACPSWPLLHCCSRPPTPLLALQLALQQPIPPPLSSSADSSARQQLPARPAAAILARALILPQRRYAGFYCCYHCCQLSYSLCHDRPCHANWPPVSLAPVRAPTPTRFLNSVGYFSRATLSRLRRQAQLIPLAALPTSA